MYHSQYRGPPPSQQRPRYNAPRPQRGPPNPNWEIPENSCWKCLRPGHKTATCYNAPFCPWHETFTHGFNDCAQYKTYSDAALARLYDRRPNQTSAFLASDHPQYHLEDTAPYHQDPHTAAHEEYLQFMKSHLAN